MSKDKGKKETKKAPATEGSKKNTSDYQSGKKSVSADLNSKKK